LNTNPNIRVVLTRETDVFNTVVQVAEIAQKFSPDLFISVHANSAAPVSRAGNKSKESPQKGVELYIASKDKAYDYESNYQLANMVGNTISEVVNPFLGIKSRDKGVYVLQTIKCPSILVETGFVSNKEELKLLKNETYQNRMALSILQGVEQYLAAKERNKDVKVKDVNLGEISVNDGSVAEFSARSKSVKKDSSGNIEYLKFEGNPYYKFREQYASKEGVLYLLNGKKISSEKLNDITPDMIQEIKLIDDMSYIKKLTSDNVKHVVQITTNRVEISFDTPFGHIITVTDYKPINNAVKVFYLHTNPPIVEGYDLKDPVSRNTFARKFAGEKGVDKLVKDAANYYPSKKVNEFKKSSILATQVDHPADFPGREQGWQKYLQKNLNRDIPVEKGAPPGKYTVKLTFVVQPNGVIKDLKVKEDPGYGTVEEVVRIITKGPNWRPAIHKQKAVASLVEKKVTFVISDESDPVKSKDADVIKRKEAPLDNNTAKKFTLIVDANGNVRW